EGARHLRFLRFRSVPVLQRSRDPDDHAFRGTDAPRPPLTNQQFDPARPGKSEGGPAAGTRAEGHRPVVSDPEVSARRNVVPREREDEEMARVSGREQVKNQRGVLLAPERPRMGVWGADLDDEGGRLWRRGGFRPPTGGERGDEAFTRDDCEVM